MRCNFKHTIKCIDNILAENASDSYWVSDRVAQNLWLPILVFQLFSSCLYHEFHTTQIKIIFRNKIVTFSAVWVEDKIVERNLTTKFILYSMIDKPSYYISWRISYQISLQGAIIICRRFQKIRGTLFLVALKVFLNTLNFYAFAKAMHL